MVFSIRHSLSRRLRRANARDRTMIMQLDLELLSKMLWPLFIAFICLDFLDTYSTLVAMRTGLIFQEENPIAAALFDMQFQGFLLALAFKYLPAIPLFYAVFVSDRGGSHQYAIRVVKFTALVTLCGADAFLFGVVALNNMPALFRAFQARG